MSKTRTLEMPKVLAQNPFLEFFVGLHKNQLCYITYVPLRQYQSECLKTI